MSIPDLSDAIEIFSKNLYWVSLDEAPLDTADAHFFSIDEELVYEPFCDDFGPLNLGMTYRYCRLIDAKLEDPNLQGKVIIHYCSSDERKRANAAYLICAYQVIARGRSAEAAWAPFQNASAQFLGFRDATDRVSTFELHITDCLDGLEFAIKLGWLEYAVFNVESYEFFDSVENGDMNWILPGKFLAMAGPSGTKIHQDGMPALTPEDFVEIFMGAKIQLVVRLNQNEYDSSRFTQHGVRHIDLYFPDGSCPPLEVINRFLHITEREEGAVAVHCTAGLGRTGSLIALYCMKHYKFPARAFIAWNRICRPGSILGPQQHFLVEMEGEMLHARRLFRGVPHPLDAGMKDFHTGENEKEDKGQGDRLLRSKAAKRSGSPEKFSHDHHHVGPHSPVEGKPRLSDMFSADIPPPPRSTQPHPGQYMSDH